MKNILICGGAGFVGGHLTEWILKNETVKRIVVYDNLSSGTWKNVPNHHSVQFVTADIKDTDKLGKAMDGIDTVFMLAANPDISRAAKEPDIDFREGTVLVQNVLEAMRLNGSTRIFYMSGSGVYGENPDVEFREDYGPMLPISTYGASKLACEALICSYCHMFGFTGRSFRCANIVGPRQTHGVGYDFLRQLRKDPTQLTILGDGTQTKSYIHISDVLRAIFLIEHLASESFGVYNVATNDTVSVSEIAGMAKDLAGLHPVFSTYTGGNRGWKGDVPIVRMNCYAIRQFGWKPHRTSSQAMGDALLSMKEATT